MHSGEQSFFVWSTLIFSIFALVVCEAADALVKGGVATAHHAMLMYCPGDTRLSYQFEMLLGAIAACETLSRYLVLLPLVEQTCEQSLGSMNYDTTVCNPQKVKMVPFGTIFDISVLAKKIGVLNMSQLSSQTLQVPASCLKVGVGDDSHGTPCSKLPDISPVCSNFWAQNHVQFITNRPYSQLLSVRGRDHPVLALSRPRPFPVPANTVNQDLHLSLRWSPSVHKHAHQMMRRLGLRSAPFVALHLNVGKEWHSFCSHNATTLNPLFETCSEQGSPIPEETCNPDRATVLHQITAALDRAKVCTLLVISDTIDMDGSDFEGRFDPTDLDAQHCQGPIEVQLAHALRVKSSLTFVGSLVVVASRASGFVGYCCSRFSDLVARERVAQGWKKKTNWRWGFNEPQPIKRRSRRRQRGNRAGQSKSEHKQSELTRRGSSASRKASHKRHQKTQKQKHRKHSGVFTALPREHEL